MSSACRRKTHRCLAGLVVNLALWAVYEVWGDDIVVFHLLPALCHAIVAPVLAVVGSEHAEGMLGGVLFLLRCAYFRAIYWISAPSYPLALGLVLLGSLCFGEYLRGRGIFYGLGIEFLAHLAVIVGWVAYMGI